MSKLKDKISNRNPVNSMGTPAAATSESVSEVSDTPVDNSAPELIGVQTSTGLPWAFGGQERTVPILGTATLIGGDSSSGSSISGTDAMSEYLRSLGIKLESDQETPNPSTAQEQANPIVYDWMKSLGANSTNSLSTNSSIESDSPPTPEGQDQYQGLANSVQPTAASSVALNSASTSASRRGSGRSFGILALAFIILVLAAAAFSLNESVYYNR